MVKLETRWIWGTCVAAVAWLAQAMLICGAAVAACYAAQRSGRRGPSRRDAAFALVALIFFSCLRAGGCNWDV